jgi:hypothetical protein
LLLQTAYPEFAALQARPGKIALQFVALSARGPEPSW